ncbi:MAG: hypothetical protein JNL73_03310 [Anaerolineales bacterium]|nr:hypothetical protein [Anaerolineales bacterium]
MSIQSPYTEDLSSPRTEALFVGLTLLGAALAAWRGTVGGFDWLTLTLAGLAVFFGFYALNFRTLRIRLTPDVLQLTFGVFTWRVPIGNIEACRVDDVSLWRIGGAGIHFSLIQGRYRAMFNFLEYSRLVVLLRQGQGPVRAVAFSTRRVDELRQRLQALTTPAGAPGGAW